ncbi:hypothetical protein LB531_21230 [Mesorhizobium sp. CO1-1-2]|uniref:hypothetical protein n=1 Tax=Mesorhizobium sp. CO1-1-2 TaxID=2876635 RepID=UPI001CCAB999|nr:hypothetical protein [Mesorhizobium sp. CO1-1-2]MBZ9683184.1 hypothetical protein [Mesorhizobium sp. CO1-1-2]
MSNQIHNERTKMFADYINNLAVVAMSTGAIIPAVTATLSTQELGFRTFIPLIVGGILATALRFCVSWALGNLKDD